MKRALFLTGCLLVIWVSPSFAQEQQSVSLSSTVPDYARYEVVQSPLIARLTFRLDRFTGETWEFVSKQNGGYTWQSIERIPLPNDSKMPSKVNYQMFLSGIRAQVTILMNTNTGASWYIAKDPKIGIFWSPMKEVP